MKYGILNYEENKSGFNIGDHIQSLAARQYLPSCDYLIYRDNLKAFDGLETTIIMNGWYSHKPNDWVPKDNINPLFVSFHLNSQIYEIFLSAEGINYLKKHQPIGCRDYATVEKLKNKGIDAYFSGCLTLTLDCYKVPESERTDNIYIVDPFFNLPTLKSIFLSKGTFKQALKNGDFFKLNTLNKYISTVCDSELLKTAKYRTHVLPGKTFSDQEKFKMAENLLNEYAKARFVITSRIHCALPCLAMGTPVIFLNAFDKELDTCRFDGIEELFNRIDIMPNGTYKANFNMVEKLNNNFIISNPIKHVEIAKKIRETCENFMFNIKL